MGGGHSGGVEVVNTSGREAQLVKAKIKENCIMIFSKTYCPSCKLAKRIFQKMGVAYEVMELDKHKDGENIQNVLYLMTGSLTVPRVFIGGHCIGGGNETKHMYSNGTLKSLVSQCEP